MYAGKPIIGIVGGIGSGKSFVARCFGELGCRVIDSDAQVREAYRDPKVIETLRQWWGDAVLGADGQIDRRFITRQVFEEAATTDEQSTTGKLMHGQDAHATGNATSNATARHRLEQLLHPWVNAAREREMKEFAGDPSVLAFVWDAPLLLETGLAGACNSIVDSIVYVDAPLQTRRRRVRETRGWDDEELRRRENLQWALDKKREISDHVLSNTADAAWVRDQVRELLPRILAHVAKQ